MKCEMVILHNLLISIHYSLLKYHVFNYPRKDD